MDRNRVTVRYAKALVELSQEKELLDVISTDIKLLYQSMIEYPGFNEYIINPGTSSKNKFEKIKEIFASDFQSLTIQFLNLVFEKNREEYLKDICRNFIDMSRNIKGEITAELITAQKLNKKLTTSITEAFEKKLNASIELTSTEKPEIIGGFIFTIEGEQYDASLATKLEKIKSQLQLK